MDPWRRDLGIGTLGIGTLGIGTLGIGTLGIGTQGLGIFKLGWVRRTLSGSWGDNGYLATAPSAGTSLPSTCWPTGFLAKCHSIRGHRAALTLLLKVMSGEKFASIRKKVFLKHDKIVARRFCVVLAFRGASCGDTCLDITEIGVSEIHTLEQG
jgi:hypothetical protein